MSSHPPPQAKDTAFLKYVKNITSLPPEEVLEDIRQGKKFATGAIANLERTPKELAYRQKLIDGGLIGIVLGLLRQCEDTKFSDLVSNDSCEGPAVWTSILSNIILMPSGTKAETWCMEIVESK